MPRCVRCHREIAATCHGNQSARVDGFRLHTGKTKHVTKQNDGGEKLEYEQLYEPQDVYLCVDCFGEAAVRDFWLHCFPPIDGLGTLCR